MKKWAIEVDAVVTPDKSLKKTKIVINDGYIEEITNGDPGVKNVFSLGESVASPGLINAHDHLLGSYYPKVGKGPYENWLPWDNDLKSDKVYQERQQVTNRDLYLLGAYRNLISGVTSVQDHIPHFVQDPFIDILPTKLVSEYTLAHSIASFALNWGEGVSEEYERAEKNNLPFITHIAEGFDEETVRDLDTLKEKNGLGPHSVLIHGIAFTPEDIKDIKKADASIVWCGDSNTFMFNETLNVKEALKQGVNLCIGTDSPMSGGLNILEEMRFDRKLYKKMYDEDISDKQLVGCVTKNSAKALRLEENGELAKGKLADIAVFSHTGKDPFASIVDAELKDVKLVIIEGMPVYGDKEFFEIFQHHGMDVTEVVIDGVPKLVIGDIHSLLGRIRKAVGFEKKFPFLPVS
jgi:cytosine/adenosine deaminase-related metal-dependent hydrolase